MSACPWPAKVKHTSKANAQKAIAKLEKAGRGSPDDNAYRCGGHWHVGHSRVSFEKRIRKALRGR